MGQLYFLLPLGKLKTSLGKYRKIGHHHIYIPFVNVTIIVIIVIIDVIPSSLAPYTSHLAAIGRNKLKQMISPSELPVNSPGDLPRIRLSVVRVL